MRERSRPGGAGRSVRSPGVRILVTALVGCLAAVGILLSPAMASVTRIAKVAPKSYGALAETFDNVGVGDDTDGSAGDLDGQGDGFSSTALENAGWVPGTDVTVNGTTLTWPDVRPGEPDNVAAAGQVIHMSGSSTALSFLATSTGGTATGSGTVVYVDGTRSPYTVTVPDWLDGPADAATLTMPRSDIVTNQPPSATKLYTVSVPLQPGKKLRTVVLPRVSAPAGHAAPVMHLFAMGLRSGSDGLAGTWAADSSGLLKIGRWQRRTLRLVVHASIGGPAVRIRLANNFATAPVTIGRATIAVQATGGTAAAAPAVMTFHGQQSVTIPAGGEAISDLTQHFDVLQDSNLLVSIYLPGPVDALPVHGLTLQDSFVTDPDAGDHTGDITPEAYAGATRSLPLLTGVDVLATGGSVVVIGDSITDGAKSTPNANARWPNALASRLLVQHDVPLRGVLNAGISNNLLLTDQYTGAGTSTNTGGTSGLSRFDRDVLAQTGVRTVIVLEGINDLRAGASAAQVIAGLRTLAGQAHAYHLRVVGATIMPVKGTVAFSPVQEQARRAVNRFIRDSGGVFDAVVDFDKTMADPDDPQRLLPQYNSGDGVHPNDAGYLAMANAVDLRVLG